MCGFIGFVDSTMGRPEGRTLAARMTDTIVHRGPDSSGVWDDAPGGAFLGFRRLAIIDLTVEGHQPMTSASGKYAIAFNGEIYNHELIRDALEAQGHTFRGRSDTEVLLTAIDAWGLEPTLRKAVGMFAFALWDMQSRTMYLARDRMGEKPLYYGWVGKSFVFASELKAFAVHPDWQGEIDRNALASFLRYKYIPAPHSIYIGIRKLPPGNFLVLRNAVSGVLPDPTAYWSLQQVAAAGVASPRKTTAEEASKDFEAVLQQAVTREMMSDVPLGAFLSGGIDSSTIVALMQKAATNRVKTFTIGFAEETHNEAEHAKAVARHLGTEHTELYVTPADAMDVIPSLGHIWDEPFGDASQIPTYLLAKLTRQHVTVALSGDGGDELLAGYRRYDKAAEWFGKVGYVPAPLRNMIAALLRAAIPATGSQRHRVDLLQRIVRTNGIEELYDTLLSGWRDPHEIVIGASKLPAAVPFSEKAFSTYDRMQLTDAYSYLPDDVLVKVDRATMAVSLESRAPLLDHEVVEFVWNLPEQFRHHPTQSKWLLRQVLYKYVPAALIERPKRGFGVPIGLWLRGPLREWAESLLNETTLAKQGFLNPKAIRKAWLSHLHGPRPIEPEIWSVLMFCAWHEAQLGATTPSYRDEEAARVTAAA